MMAEIFGALSTVICCALLVLGFICWVKAGGFNKMIDGMEKDADRQNDRLNKKLKVYEKYLKQANILLELKDLEIEELKRKEKNNEK